MRLIVATPFAIITDSDHVVQVRAEDETGAFGLLPGHADFVTALAVSLITWRDGDGHEHHVAVRGGMLQVQGGNTVSVATPEAIAGDDLHHLETDVLTSFRRQLSEEQVARTDAQRLYLAAIRQIIRYLRPQSGGQNPVAAMRDQVRNVEP